VLSCYWRAIELAIEQGYRGEPKSGDIYGKSGKRLSLKRYGKQEYPTVRLHVDGLPATAYSVPAYKFMAFVIWGRAAFAKGIHVRHLDGDSTNIRGANLLLGTPSQNEFDKPAAVRNASAKAARAAQGRAGPNAILTESRAKAIRRELEDAPRSRSGRIQRGVVKEIAGRYGVSSSTVSLIGKGGVWVV
jgi:hypothetical protein